MKTTRRRFLNRVATSLATVTLVPRKVLGGKGYVPPSETVNVALVGAGGQGTLNSRALFQEKEARIIAVADPAEQYSLEAFYYGGMGGRKPVGAEIERHYHRNNPDYRCAVYEDFRIMLEKEKDIDAILCATPDHLHAYVCIRAMRLGKHVYCEKPLTHNIWEARQVARVAKDTGVATQLGNQGHSNEGIRQTCEWIWDGVIGTVREAHAWVRSSRWNKALTDRPKDTPPVPQGMNWDLWLGPRSYRPYHPLYAPVTWRDFWAFGSGTLGDFGCHDLDAACWALDLHTPLSVNAYPAGKTNEEVVPLGEMCYYEFGARGNQPPVKVTWYSCGLKPPCPDTLPRGSSLPRRATLFVGDKGMMVCGGAGGAPRLLPYEKTRDYQRQPQTIPRVESHHRDWLNACKGGNQASSNFEYGARLTELALLGVASLRTGKKLYWDARTMSAPGVPELEEIIQEDYRKGWEIT